MLGESTHVFIFSGGSYWSDAPEQSAWAYAVVASDGQIFKVLGYFSALTVDCINYDLSDADIMELTC